MFVESVYEFVNVSANDIDVHFVCSADFVHNACLLASLLNQLEDFRADEVDREHLALTHIEKDSSILGLSASNCVGGI
jgi:hypothetical protein